MKEGEEGKGGREVCEGVRGGRGREEEGEGEGEEECRHRREEQETGGLSRGRPRHCCFLHQR